MAAKLQIRRNESITTLPLAQQWLNLRGYRRYRFCVGLDGQDAAF